MCAREHGIFRAEFASMSVVKSKRERDHGWSSSSSNWHMPASSCDAGWHGWGEEQEWRRQDKADSQDQAKRKVPKRSTGASHSPNEGGDSTKKRKKRTVLVARQADGHSAVVMKSKKGKELCKIPNGEKSQ